MRKVCDSMPKQRHLLILALLACVIPAFAESSFFVKTSVQNISAEQSGWLLQNRFGWQQELAPRLNFSLDAEQRWSDIYLRDNPQKAWYGSLAALDWQKGTLALKAAYRNISFGDAAPLQLYPNWAPTTEYRRKTQHQAALAADWRDNVRGWVMYKRLNALPYTLDFNTFELVQGEETGLEDLYGGLGLAWKPSENWKLAVGADHKDGTFVRDDLFRVTKLTASAEAQYSLDYGSRLEGSLAVEHREAGFADSQRENVLRTRLRLQKRVTSELSSLLVWENNSCFDNKFHALRLISNYLRLQAVLNLPYDPAAASYILGGVKYSPENDASALFAETDCLIGWHSYAGCGAQIIPERQSILKGWLSHRFWKNQEVRLGYSRVENLANSAHTDQVGVSAAFWW